METTKIVTVTYTKARHTTATVCFEVKDMSDLISCVHKHFRIPVTTDVTFVMTERNEIIGNYGAIPNNCTLKLKIDRTSLFDAFQLAKKELRARLVQLCTHCKKKGERCTIVLLGRSGAGKTSTVNSLFGQEILPTSNVRACTTVPVSTIVPIKESGLSLELIDTPGLQDENGRDNKFVIDLQQFLRGKTVHCVLYVTDVTKSRFDASDKAILGKLTMGLGKDLWSRAVVVLTHANAVDAFPKPAEIPLSEYNALSREEKYTKHTTAAKKNIKENFKQFHHNIPTVLVDNVTNAAINNEGASLLVDGTPWKEELVNAVLSTMKDIDALTLAVPLLDSPNDEISTSVFRAIRRIITEMIAKIKENTSKLAKTAWNFVTNRIGELFHQNNIPADIPMKLLK